MNIKDKPELLDKLAANYALGTLRGPARRRFEAMARDSVVARVAILTWQERLAGLTEIASEVAPPPYVWTRIANAIELERTSSTTLQEPTQLPGQALSELTSKLRQAMKWWRDAAFTRDIQ